MLVNIIETNSTLCCCVRKRNNGSLCEEKNGPLSIYHLFGFEPNSNKGVAMVDNVHTSVCI